MAFPSITGSAEDFSSGAVTAHTFVTPATVNAGDLLLVLCAKGGTAAVTMSFDVGGVWTELLDENTSSGVMVAYKLADGTEDAATIALTSSAGNRMAFICYAISGAISPATQPPEISTVATGSGTAPDPTTCTPTGGAKDYLWITFFANGATEEANDDTWLNNAATGYGSALQVTSGTGGVNVGAILGASSRTNNAASEDAAWPSGSTDTSAAWRAYTIAVHLPAAAATSFIPPRQGQPSGLYLR